MIFRYIFNHLLTFFVTAYYAFRAVIGGMLGHAQAVNYINGVRWARLLLKGCGVKVTQSGLEKINLDQPLLFLTNHRSHFDTPALMATIEKQVVFVAKRELEKIPVFGASLRSVGMIYIERGNSEQARQSVAKAVEDIRKGKRVLMFPEGTRSNDGHTLEKFKKGSFHMAKAARVPVVPVVVQGSEKVLPKYKVGINPGHIHLTFLEPIQVSGEENVEELMQRVHSKMEAVIEPKEENK